MCAIQDGRLDGAGATRSLTTTLASTVEYLQPMYTSFDHVGVNSSVLRSALRCSSKLLSPRMITYIPAWVWHGKVSSAVRSVRAMRWYQVHNLCSAVDALMRASATNTQPGVADDQMQPLCPFPSFPSRDDLDVSHAVNWTEAELQKFVLHIRIRTGEVLERWCNREWDHNRRVEQKARLMFDSYACAVWTSCHAEHCIHLHESEALQIHEVPDAELGSCPCASNEPSLLHALSERSLHGPVERSTNGMHQLMMRSVNPSSRGWASSMAAILKSSDGCRAIVGNALLVSFMGLHPHLEPPARPGWHTRAITLRRLQGEIASASYMPVMMRCNTAVKEAVRRLFASTLDGAIPMLDVLHMTESPLALLVSPPRSIPAHGIRNAMRAFALAAVDVAGHQAAQPTALDVVRCHMSTLGLDSQWMGKSQQMPPLLTAMEHMERVVYDAFRSRFVPLWLYGQSQSVRMQRLDQVQHDAAHIDNPALVMANSVPLEEALRIQRLVLQHPEASTLSMTEVCKLLDAEFEGGTGAAADAGAETGAWHADLSRRPNSSTAICTAVGPSQLPRMLSFARVAWLADMLLLVDLGQRTRRAHSLAIAARHHAIDRAEEAQLTEQAQLDQILDRLPISGTHLLVCTECRRVGNALPATVIDSEFNEVGVRATTVQPVSDGIVHAIEAVHCSKRSSAALRSAVAAEQDARRRRVEAPSEWHDDVCFQSIARVAMDGTLTSRMRRDCRRALCQKRSPLACGECRMVSIPLVGRAVRIFGTWYSICAFCGTAMRVCSYHRLEAEMWCGGCTPTRLTEGAQLGPTPSPHVLYSHCTELQTARNPTEEPAGSPCSSAGVALFTNDDTLPSRMCRYCGRVEGDERTGPSKHVFVAYESPHDEMGRNMELPPSQRVTWWCPKHHRRWMRELLLIKPTSYVLAHLSENVRPVDAGYSETIRPAAARRSTIRRGGIVKRKRK